MAKPWKDMNTNTVAHLSGMRFLFQEGTLQLQIFCLKRGVSLIERLHFVFGFSLNIKVGLKLSLELGPDILQLEGRTIARLQKTWIMPMQNREILPTFPADLFVGPESADAFHLIFQKTYMCQL
jgi:hypothetical protein